MAKRKIDPAAVLAWFKKPRNWTTVVLPVAAIVTLLVVGRVIDLHVYIEAMRGWIFSFGPWGPVVYALIYVVAELAFFPGTPFTIIAALIFGTLWGYVTMLVAATVAAVAAFLIARYLARERIQRRLDRHPEFRKMISWVERNHWLAIPFVRIMPFFPFSVNNYALGLTNISFKAFLLTSLAVFVPMTGVLVLGASALYRAMIMGEVSWWLIIGTVTAGLVIFGIGIAGKRAFNSTHEREEPSDPAGENANSSSDSFTPK
jgi:uncharacterized membrane protein YdjX (TVP38/TMEM64 family)